MSLPTFIFVIFLKGFRISQNQQKRFQKSLLPGFKDFGVMFYQHHFPRWRPSRKEQTREVEQLWENITYFVPIYIFSLLRDEGAVFLLLFAFLEIIFVHVPPAFIFPDVILTEILCCSAAEQQFQNWNFIAEIFYVRLSGAKKCHGFMQIHLIYAH